MSDKYKLDIKQPKKETKPKKKVVKKKKMRIDDDALVVRKNKTKHGGSYRGGRKPKQYEYGVKKTVFVNPNDLDNAKKILKHLKSERVYDNSNQYRKRKLREFEQQLQNAKTKNQKEQFIKDFNRYLGIRKDGSLNFNRKKANFRKENGEWVVGIRVAEKKNNTSKASTQQDGLRKRIYRDKGDWNSIWNEMKSILAEYNLPTYWTDFYSDLYPDWVDRARQACEDLHPFIEDISGEQFIDLCDELIKRYGW